MHFTDIFHFAPPWKCCRSFAAPVAFGYVHTLPILEVREDFDNHLCSVAKYFHYSAPLLLLPEASRRFLEMLFWKVLWKKSYSSAMRAFACLILFSFKAATGIYLSYSFMYYVTWKHECWWILTISCYLKLFVFFLFFLYLINPFLLSIYIVSLARLCAVFLYRFYFNISYMRHIVHHLFSLFSLEMSTVPFEYHI